MKPLRTILLLVFLGVLGHAPAISDDGERVDLDWDLLFTLEAIRNVSGGIEQDRAVLGTVDLTVDLRLGSHNRVHAYALGIFHDGPLPSEFVGDIQGTSNIEAPETVKFLELWYERSWGKRSWGEGDRSGLLVGRHDYNSEFDTLDAALLFRQSSFGLSAELGQVPPSTYADTALGLRYRTEPSERSYFLAGLYEGVSGDGLFGALEYGRRWADGRGKIGLGLWQSTSDFIGADGLTYDRNRGAYLVAELPVWKLKGQELAGFVQAGTARRTRNDIDAYYGAGLNLQNRWGLAIGSAEFSDGRDAETVIELTFLQRVNRWIEFQPDVQWVLNPGGGETLDDAVQLGVTLWIRVP